MELIVMIALGICLFMFCVYFTRWVFGIDQIINLQKDILNELQKKSELKPEKLSMTNRFCKSCGTIMKNNDTICSKCGLKQ